MNQNMCCNLQRICTHCAKYERPQSKMKEKLVINADRFYVYLTMAFDSKFILVIGNFVMCTL